MTRLERALIRLHGDLGALDVEAALIGGLALAVRAEPRTTQDIDLAVQVDSDSDAERVVRALQRRGYAVSRQMENERTGRLAAVRLRLPDHDDTEIVADLLLDFTGVEAEVVTRAPEEQVLPELQMRVVRTGDLLALKIHAGRRQDLADAEAILRRAAPVDIEDCRSLLRLIGHRGGAPDRDLESELAVLLADQGPGRS